MSPDIIWWNTYGPHNFIWTVLVFRTSSSSLRVHDEFWWLKKVWWFSYSTSKLGQVFSEGWAFISISDCRQRNLKRFVFFMWTGVKETTTFRQCFGGQLLLNQTCQIMHQIKTCFQHFFMADLMEWQNDVKFSLNLFRLNHFL